MVAPIGPSDIGTAGQAGFGVGVSLPALPAGYTYLGTTDRAGPNFGRYLNASAQPETWVPACWLRVGSTESPRYAEFGVDAVDVLPLRAYYNLPDAAADGYFLHPALDVDKQVQSGFFAGASLTADQADYVQTLQAGFNQAFAQLYWGNGEQGAWYDPSDLSTLFQDSAGTTPVTAAADPIGRVVDKSGNAVNATQATATARPTYRTGPVRLSLDKVDDALVITVPTGGFVGTMVLSTVEGTAAYGINIPAGSHTIGGQYYPTEAGSAGGIVGIVMLDREMTQAEIDGVSAYFVSRGGGPVGAGAYAGVTSLRAYWRGMARLTSFPLVNTAGTTDFFASWFGCSSLTSFPLLDVSAGTNFTLSWTLCAGLTSFPLLDVSSGTGFIQTWQGCSSLTSFPLLDVSSGTNFNSTWLGCSALTNFPANFFDGVLATSFQKAFSGTNLSQTSIDNILVSINSNGTSGGTFDQSGGSAPSVTGQAAITAMRSRGWTVTVTGGF